MAIGKERYQERSGFWRPIIGTVVRKFLECGDLNAGDIHALMAASAGEDLVLDQAAVRLGLSPVPRPVPLPPPQLLTAGP